VLGGDTVVACGRRILAKCSDAAAVRRSLSLLSGRRHRVYGGVCVVTPQGVCRTRLVESVVRFKKLSLAELEAYSNCGEGVGKAGGYALQGQAAALIAFVSGSPSNVIGLPLFETAQLLRSVGYFT